MTDTTPAAVDWDDIPDTPEQRKLIADHNAEMKRAYPNLIEIDALSAQLEAANQRAEMLADSVAKARAEGKAEGLREAAMVCDGQKVHFLSPEYATHQPLSSHSERFACGVCAAAILALIPADTPAAKVTVQEAARVLLGDDYTSPLIEVLDAYNNDYDVAQDVLKALRAIAGGRDE